MFSFSLLLHLHQPPTQFPEVLRLVFQQSYQPLLEFLLGNPWARLTLNITASLLEQLGTLGMKEWLGKLETLVAEGKVELTGTAAYHALLPKLPGGEAVRQIRLNELFLQRLHLVRRGATFRGGGFFPPEMAVEETTMRLMGEMGYSWVTVDEAAVSGRPNLQRNGLLAWEGSTLKKEEKLKLVVRNKDLSLKLAFGQIRNLNDFLSYANNHKPMTNSLIVALDGETFGHHHPELLPFLEELMANSGRGEYQLVTVSELISKNRPLESVGIRSSTWSDGWGRWHDPDNLIHRKQWQLTNLAIRAVNESKFKIYNLKSKIKDQRNYRFDLLDFKSDPEAVKELDLSPKSRQWWEARRLLDRALHSDQYWWASARPNWHYKMVERGARLLRDAVAAVPHVPERYLLDATYLYNEVTRLGLEKYGDTVIT